MKKNSTVAVGRKRIFKQARLTIGLDLGDRTSHYCMLDEAGNVILERSLPTTSSGKRQAFGRIARYRIALETGTHSPWLSRQGVARCVGSSVAGDPIVERAHRGIRWSDRTDRPG